ncbi:MAG: hypothetical protein ACAI25_07570 [Planctomycetota bacterium]
MDDELLLARRRFAESPALATLEPLLRALVRARRHAEVPPLLDRHARNQLDELGATTIASFEGWWHFGLPTLEDLADVAKARRPSALVAKQLGGPHGGFVFLETADRHGKISTLVSPGDTLELEQASVHGEVWAGATVTVWIRAPGAASPLAHFARSQDERGDLLAELQTVFRPVAAAAGATLSVTTSAVFWD